MEILDQEEHIDNSRYIDMSRFNDRILHFVLDGIFTLIGSFIIEGFLDSLQLFEITTVPTEYIILAAYMLYYFIAEMIFQKTLGKRIRNCHVVDINMNHPKAWQIIIRTIVRPIPFQFVTAFLSYKRPLHDILSKTYVVKSIKKRK